MKSRFWLSVTLLVILFTVFSCRETEKSVEVLEQSWKVYDSAELDSKERLNQSLKLVNQAIEHDYKNTNAYMHKIRILMEMKDIEKLLETNDKLLELFPKSPYYLGQQGLFYELAGDSVKAHQSYDEAIKQSNELITENPTDFDRMMEYVMVLQLKGDTTLANAKLKEAEKMELPGWQGDSLSDTIPGMNETRKHETKMLYINLYRSKQHDKKYLFEYWNGEITYNEMIRAAQKGN